ARERHGLRGLDRLDRVRRGDLGVAVELEELLLREPVELRERADEPELPQPPDRLLPNAVDVARPLHPGDERLQAARGAGAVGTPVHRLALRLDDLRVAERA